jgi:Na+/proline symporter
MFLWIVLLVVGLLMLFFVPKWLFWITPKAYSVYDVLSEQYGRRTSLLIIALVAAVMAGIFFILEWGSMHGW